MKITGARTVLAPLPPGSVDPLGLPSCCPEGFSGYVAISRPEQPGAFDLLFIDRSRVFRCGRVDNGIRALQTLEALRVRLRIAGKLAVAELFEAPRMAMDLFLSTFGLRARVRFPAELLSDGEIRRILLWCRIHKGILEVDLLTGTEPSIDLVEFSSLRDLLALGALVRRGWFLLYDLGGPPRTARRDSAPACLLPSETPACVLPGEPEDRLHAARAAARVRGSPPASPVPMPAAKSPEVEPPAPPPVPSGVGDGVRTPPPGTALQTPEESPDDAQAAFLRAVGDMLGAFSRDAKTEPGVEEMLKAAAERVRQNRPGFDPAQPAPGTVFGVFELLGHLAAAAPTPSRAVLVPLMKRHLAELHNRHFDTVDRHGGIAPLLRLYYTLFEGDDSARS